MTTLMRELEQKAATLTAEERELLAERLLATVSGVPLSDVDEAWVAEAERRYAESVRPVIGHTRPAVCGVMDSARSARRV